MKPPGAPSQHRLFFALWPDTLRRRALATATEAAVGQVDGIPVQPANLHVTLAFIGMVPGNQLAALIEIGGQGGYASVKLEFDRLEYWRKPRVLVALPALVPRAGLEVVDWLWGRIERLGFLRESRLWQPHLTLARRIRHTPPAGLELQVVKAPRTGRPGPWGLALVESTSYPTGVRYKALADWPLGR